MICPQTKAECVHNCSAWMISCKEAVKPPPVAGRTLAADCAPTRGRAMMAEIERLVDAYGNNQGYLMMYKDEYCTDMRNQARAALMAAIRAYGME